MNTWTVARMDGRRWLFAASLATLLFGPAFAQSPLVIPSDVDLRASYCIAVTQFDISVHGSVLHDAVPGNEWIDKIIADSRRSLILANSNLRKLQQYLLPRMLYLDPTGLLTAGTSAKDDVARMKRMSYSCPTECDGKANHDACYSGCVDREMPDLKVVQDKFKTCRELNWLPL
jgi:hypothetical protein